MSMTKKELGQERFLKTIIPMPILPKMELGYDSIRGIDMVQVKKYFVHMSNRHDCDSAYGAVLGRRQLRMFNPGLTVPFAMNLIEVIRVKLPDLVGDATSALDYGDYYTDGCATLLQPEDVVNIINHDGRKIGRFYITSQSLLLCDLPHNEATIPYVNVIITKLVEKNFLTAMDTREVESWSDKKIRVTLGADPEFEYLNSRGDITSSFPNSMFGGVYPGCGDTNEIGIDGAGTVVEFRPRPAKCASKLRDNMKALMNKVRGHHLSTIGDGYAAGCHLHFGFFSCYPPDDMVLILDDFLGIPCKSLNGRERGDYAGLGSVRQQPWGFEYRSLPAAVANDPEFFRIICKLGKQIVEKYVNRKVIKYEVQRARVAGDLVYIPTPESYKYMGITQSELFTMFNTIEHYKRDYNKSVVACWQIPDATEHTFSGRLPREEDEDEDGDEYENVDIPSEERRREHRTCAVPIGTETMQVNFYDSWDPQTRGDVLNWLQSTMADIDFSRIPPTIRLSITIGGLRNDRGYVVCGFVPPANSSSNYAHTELSNILGGEFTYGFSRIFRSGALYGMDADYYADLLRAFGDTVLNDIKNRYIREQGADDDIVGALGVACESNTTNDFIDNMFGHTYSDNATTTISNVYDTERYIRMDSITSSYASMENSPLSVSVPMPELAQRESSDDAELEIT